MVRHVSGQVRIMLTEYYVEVPEAKSGKNRLHLDLVVDDLEASAAEIEALGGRWLEPGNTPQPTAIMAILMTARCTNARSRSTPARSGFGPGAVVDRGSEHGHVDQVADGVRQEQQDEPRQPGDGDRRPERSPDAQAFPATRDTAVARCRRSARRGPLAAGPAGDPRRDGRS